MIVAERMLGLGALGMFFAVGLIFGQGAIIVEAAGLWVVGLSSLVICVLAIGLMGRRLTRWWRSAPTLTHPMYVLYATALSLVTHSITVIAFWVLTRSMHLDVSLIDLAVIVPVALVASVVPLAIAGVGPREVALVALIPLLNLGTDEQALLLSVAFAASNWVLGGLGGLLQLMMGRQALAIDGPGKMPQSRAITSDYGTSLWSV